MAEPSSVIVLEFNELSTQLMDRFIAEGCLPNFARFRSESTVAVTDPEEPQDRLNPWIQWVTLHTGTPRSLHGIEKLGEASRLRQPTMGQAIAEGGRSVWICGAMNLPASAAPQGAFLPDPWNPDSRPKPARFAPFSDFVRANVQEHTNAAVRMSPTLAARFAWFAAHHGMTVATVRAAISQLLAERRGRRGRWARASVLDRFQWDLFEWQYRRDRPALATFFSNSTAHYQHMYWRNLEPENFDIAPTEDEQRAYSDAVRHGYRQMDALVEKAIALADETGATLMLCTALSQQPYVHADARGGTYTYRPHDFDRLVAAIGIDGVDRVSPVMAGQFRLYLEDATAAEVAAERLRRVTVDGQPAMQVRVLDSEVFTGCAITSLLDDDVVVVDPEGGPHRFADLFYRFETTKSGYHHPDGMWWVRTGTHREIEGTVPLRAVAPTILRLLDVPIPATMQSPPVQVLAEVP